MRRASWPSSGDPTLWLVAVVVVEALATLGDLVFGPGRVPSTEETYNATAGVMVACGHLDALWALQYRPFCGGCSAEALLAAPLFRVLGPGLLAWKLVPAGLHVLAVAAGAVLCRRAADWRAAALFMGLMAAGPGFWRQASLTGFGNHAESAAFTLLAAALAAGGPGWAGALGAGVVAGLGVWFAPISAHALPALLLLAIPVAARPGWASLWSPPPRFRSGGRHGAPAALCSTEEVANRPATLRGRFLSGRSTWLAGRRAWLLACGLPLGLVPLLAYHRAVPEAVAGSLAWWTAVEPAPPRELWRFLVSDFLTSQPWPQAAWLGRTWWWTFLVVGLGSALRRRGRPGAFVLAGLLGLVGAFWLRHDLWSDNPVVRGYDWFNLRYRVPLVPLLALGGALAAGRWRWPAGILVVVGLGFRLAQWGAPPPVWQPLVQPGEMPDRTVPSGEPRQRLARALGRDVDVEAAHTYLEGHVDALSACRAEHVAELGRRLGLAALDGRVDRLARLERRWTGEGPLGAGMALAWSGEADVERVRRALRLAEVAAPGLAAEAAGALGARLAGDADDFPRLEALADEPGVLLGACGEDPRWCR